MQRYKKSVAKQKKRAFYYVKNCYIIFYFMNRTTKYQTDFILLQHTKEYDNIKTLTNQ